VFLRGKLTVNEHGALETVEWCPASSIKTKFEIAAADCRLPR
jgi:hypothetical protein